MSTVSVENIRLLFKQVSSLGFFGRIFGWKKILIQNGAAIADFQELSKRLPGIKQKYLEQQNIIINLQQEIERYKSDHVKVQSELEFQKNLVNAHLDSIKQKEREVAALKESDRQYNSRINEQEGKITRIETNTEQLQKNIQNNENELATIRETNTQNETKISELKQEIVKNRSEIDHNIKELKEKESEIGGLKESVDKSRSQIQEMKSEIERYRTTLEQKQQDILNNKNELATIRETNTQNETKISELKQEIVKNRSEIDHNIKELKEKESEIGGLKESVDKSRSQIQELKSEIERYKTTLEQKQQDILNNENELATIRETNTQNETKISELKQEIVKNRSEIDHNIKELKEKESEIGGLKESVDKSRSQIQELKSEIEHYKATLEQKQQDILNKENELATITETNTQNEGKKSELKQEIVKYKSEIEHNIKELKEKEKVIGSLDESVEGKTKQIQRLDTDIALKSATIKDLNQQVNLKDQEITKYEKAEQMRHDEYDKRITELNALRDQLNQDRLLELKNREEKIEEEHERMRNLWKEHEKRVEQVVKSISQKTGLEYIDKEKLPFGKRPDNTIKICNEYVIFDAKSPGGNGLSNFPLYVKTQAEQAKKYLFPDVHRTLFLVVPTNTIDLVDQIFYDMADYRVFVITIDALEPVIQSLKRIEEYHFAEQLDPEDRENICRVIGKFAHATKRRIQIDNYFCNQFIGILDNCRALPEEIIQKTKNYEKADKMNPPIEKRMMEIRLDTLKVDVKRLKHGCEGQDIEVGSIGDMIDKIPLEKEEIVETDESDILERIQQAEKDLSTE
jgi:chromosome segregation ATPase